MTPLNPRDKTQVVREPNNGQERILNSTLILTRNGTVMEWTIKSIAGSPKDIFWSQVAFTAAGALVILYMAFIMRENLAEEYVFFLSLAAAAGLQTTCYICVIRQKTIYRYRIYQTKARLVYRLHYPKYAREFFKGFAFVGIFLLILMGLMAGSLLFLTGVGAMAFMAAIRLLTWKNPIKRDWGLPWHEYNFVTVDRKRRFIVTHMTDDSGF